MNGVKDDENSDSDSAPGAHSRLLTTNNTNAMLHSY